MFQFARTTFSCSLLIAALLNLTGLTAHAQTNTNLRIMPLGDSITAGFRSTTADGYRGPLATSLAGQVGAVDFVGSQIDGSMLDPDNEGHFMYRIDQIAGLATGVLNNYKPNLVLLDAGINDLGQGYNVSTAPARLASLIDQILAAEPDATVLVAQLIVNTDAIVEPERETFNSKLPAIVQARAGAGKHVALVDMSALTTADLFDGLHPNDTGYQLMANAWDASIQQAIANRWIADPVSGSASRPTGKIYSGLSGQCLDDFKQSGSAGVKADLDICNQTPAQQFNVNNGQVAINGLCLDVSGGGTANETPVDLWHCTGAANQVWTVQNGTLVNPASGRCLDYPGTGIVEGTQLDIKDCDGSLNQRWRVPSEGLITSGIAGKCLDAFGGLTANGTKVDSYGCNPAPAQQWVITNNTLSFNGKCLDITGGRTTNGTPVELYTCTGGANQIWTSVNSALVNPASGRCLDNPGGNTADGIQLDIWDCGGGSNQQWALPPGTPQS